MAVVASLVLTLYLSLNAIWMVVVGLSCSLHACACRLSFFLFSFSLSLSACVYVSLFLFLSLSWCRSISVSNCLTHYNACMQFHRSWHSSVRFGLGFHGSTDVSSSHRKTAIKVSGGCKGTNGKKSPLKGVGCALNASIATTS